MKQAKETAQARAEAAIALFQSNCKHEVYTMKQAMTTYRNKLSGFGYGADDCDWVSSQKEMVTQVCSLCGRAAKVVDGYYSPDYEW